MIFGCFKCKKSFENKNFYFEHLKLKHKSLTRFDCSIHPCERVYTNLYTFIKHITRDHIENESCNDISIINERILEKNCSEASVIEPSISEEIDIDYMNESFFFDELPNSFQCQFVPQNKTNITQEIAKVIIESMSDSRIPRSVAISIFNKLFLSLEKYIQNIIENGENISGSLTNLMYPLSLRSEYMILKYLKSQNILLDFKQILISTEVIQAYSKSNNIVTKNIDYFVHLVDLKHLFYLFFSNTPIIKQILEYIEYVKTQSSIINVIQTDFWKNKIIKINPDNDPTVLILPLLVYFDDFEILNALGSHSGMQKVGAVYLKLLTLPNHLNSKLLFIFLALLFFTEDRKEFGNEKIFTPLIESLNNLQKEGIPIDYNSYKIVKLIPLIVIGDNLGVNSVLGFAESFKNNYYCRFCNCHSDDMKYQLVESSKHLRNVSNYENDHFFEYGIKEISVWNKIDNFHLYENYSVDLMHDLLEGVCHYDLLCILKIFVNDKNYFSLEILNQRILQFNFAPLHIKPPLFNLDCLKYNKLKLTASEMHTMIKFFPLLIGDLIPESLEWELFLTLREIITITYRKKHHIDSPKFLQYLIAYHNSLYIKISGSHLKPKFHFMVHYSSILKKIGPLFSINSIRFEAQHQTHKKTIYLSNNSVNSLKSINIKNQLKIANYIMNYNALTSTIKCGPIKKLKNSAIIEFQLENINETIFETNWLIFCESFLKPEMVICTNFLESELIFSIIKHIIQFNEKFYLCLKEVNTLFYNTHFASYEIEDNEDIYFVVCVDNLKILETSMLSKNANGKKFIVWDA